MMTITGADGREPTRTVAPMPSPEEQAVIDWFGIYGDRKGEPYAECRKEPYATQREANKEMGKLIRKRAVQAAIYNQRLALESGAYECPKCKQWHLTSSPWR